jgi:NADP-dependent 3-hydroxy acid dehydrogenase YdfG
VIAARTEADLDRTGEHIKKISPKTQVVKVVTDVSDKSSVENLFKEAFKRFPEVDVSDMMVRLMVDTCE